MSQVKLNYSVGTMLKATKPGSVKSLSKFLQRGIKHHDVATAVPFKGGIAAGKYPKEVVAWCVEWLKANGLDASFTTSELAYDITVLPWQGKLSFKVGSALKAIKPGSVKSLRKFLARDLKSYDLGTRCSYQCSVSAKYPVQVVAWCVEWLKQNGLVASFVQSEMGYVLTITGYVLAKK